LRTFASDRQRARQCGRVARSTASPFRASCSYAGIKAGSGGRSTAARQHENAPEFDGPSPSNPNDNSIQNDPGTLHTYDAASDPANAVDSQGRAYFSCVMFDVFSNANGLFLTQSPAGAEGAFYFNVPSSIAADSTKNFLVVEDNPNGPYAISDENFIAADRSKRRRATRPATTST
jgi:hypothetical protein